MQHTSRHYFGLSNIESHIDSTLPSMHAVMMTMTMRHRWESHDDIETNDDNDSKWQEKARYHLIVLNDNSDDNRKRYIKSSQHFSKLLIAFDITFDIAVLEISKIIQHTLHCTLNYTLNCTLHCILNCILNCSLYQTFQSIHRTRYICTAHLY